MQLLTFFLLFALFAVIILFIIRYTYGILRVWWKPS